MGKNIDLSKFQGEILNGKELYQIKGGARETPTGHSTAKWVDGFLMNDWIGDSDY